MNISDLRCQPSNLTEWVKKAKETYSKHLENCIKIVGIIGKDDPFHGKGDNINSYLNESVFPAYTEENNILSITAHYSENDQILFLVMNGADDIENMKNVFLTESQNGQSFFEKLAESENFEMRMLHFLFITCHFVIVFEPTSRITIEFIRILKRVNALRLSVRADVKRLLDSAKLYENWITDKDGQMEYSDGRLAVPRLLVAFRRNNVRSDLGSNRTREIYQKLEESLETQLTDLLQNYDLIDNQSSTFCQIDNSMPFVHLISPSIVQRDVMEEILDYFTQDPEKRQLRQISANKSFIKFLDDNLRLERKTVPLGLAIDFFQCILPVIDGEIEKIADVNIEKYNLNLKFEKRLFEDHMNEAFRIYERESKGRLPIFKRGDTEITRTKAEHDARFAESVKFLKTVMGSRVEEAVECLQKRCDDIWKTNLQPCEQISLTGIQCLRKVHATFGDETYAENKWTAHLTNETLLSTCACGISQALRQDPFTVKEANCDFYLNNPQFSCCRNLERFKFQLFEEDLGEESNDWEEWAERDRESNSVVGIGQETKKLARRDLTFDMEEVLDSDYTIGDTVNSVGNSSVQDEDIHVAHYESATTSDSEEYMLSNNRKEEDFSSKTYRELSIEFAKRVNCLKRLGREAEYIEGVPNTITAGRFPLFPSWILTCIGDSSLYNHSTGIRLQPNFKIGGEHLIPAIVFLDVDIDVWNRDVNKIRSEDYSWKYVTKPKLNDDVARVKLFIGFEYECSRGHRFFVDHYGEPLIYAKGTNVVEKSARRNSLGNILSTDLPLRRACTCRKLPHKSAQLMKIHVVTPKAPVQTTLDPMIEVPGHEGLYTTGQAPLELLHSKYYILQLPTIYSGPSGTYVHDRRNLEKIGALKAGAIKVVYKPVLSLW